MTRILVIDALNMFIRNYIVNPMISTNGNPIGGTVGFLNSIKKLMRESKPDQVIICWDGAGGSQKRRQTVKEYKQGRKPLRKNYQIEGMDKQSEKENMIWQQRILMEMLNEMPIMQLMLDRVEADDIISMVVNSPKFKGCQKVIVSSDKDFLQLLNDETVLYRPIQKKAWTKNTVIEEYGISPENFVIARAIAGDKSDNLVGIQGAGLATISKRLDFLIEDKMHTLTEVQDFCTNIDSKLKFYERVVEGWDTVETNYKVMNLGTVFLSPQNTRVIKESVENYPLEFARTEFIKMMMQDGFAELNWDDLYSSMNRIRIANAK